MRCSHCYTDNPTWATVCSSCGKSVLRLEICPAGHLLPPGEQECPICPSLWPEVDSFSGPPMLRGFLWVESGRLATVAEPAQELAYLEIRDRESPLALTLLPSGVVHLTEDDDYDARCRILMRPDGVRVCDKNQPAIHSGLPAYEPLLAGKTLRLGRTSFRHIQVRPPAWAEKPVDNPQP